MGGLYIDNDVEPLKPVDSWLPTFGRGQDSRNNLLVVGVEMPRSRGGLSLQLVNFIFVSTHPGHPALRSVIDVCNAASEVMRVSADNVIFRTGPLAFTRGVFDWLGHEIDPRATEESGVLFERKDGATGKTWRLLVLPYRAFGNHPQHGDDVNRLPLDQILVQHHFHGTWRPDKFRGRLHYQALVAGGGVGKDGKFAEWQEYATSKPNHPPMPRQ